MSNDRPTFTPAQRGELAGLGLLPEQVTTLEDMALRVGAAVLRNEDMSPARQDVSAEFKRVADALARAHDALRDLEQAGMDALTGTAARSQARERIEIACYVMTDKLGEDGVFHRLLLDLAVAQAVVTRAQADAPSEPTRRKTATPYPVKLIHDALLHGFVVAHRNKPMPAFSMEVSAGPKSPFRRVVQLCYEAMQRTNDDPDRAIKGFMSWQREERNARKVSDVPS